MSRDSSQGQQDLRGQLRELFQNAMLHLVGDIEEDSSLDMLVSISETGARRLWDAKETKEERM